MIYADVRVFNKNICFDVKLNENAASLTVIEQLSRILKMNYKGISILNKRTGNLIGQAGTFKEQNVRGGDTLVVVERLPEETEGRNNGYTC